MQNNDLIMPSTTLLMNSVNNARPHCSYIWCS